MHPLKTPTILLLLWITIAPRPAPAHLVVILEPVKDNTLYEDDQGTRSNGAGRSLFIGTNHDRAIRRALLAFDLTQQIPRGALIERVQVGLYLSQAPPDSQRIALHRALSDWGEGDSAAQNEEEGAEPAAGDATWKHAAFDSLRWQVAGGDFNPEASAEQVVGTPGFHIWEAPGLVADVQRWANQPARNFGWVILGDEERPGTVQRFSSREDAEGIPPSLLVQFDLVGGADLGAATVQERSWGHLKQIWQARTAPADPLPARLLTRSGKK